VPGNIKDADRKTVESDGCRHQNSDPVSDGSLIETAAGEKVIVTPSNTSTFSTIDIGGSTRPRSKSLTHFCEVAVRSASWLWVSPRRFRSSRRKRRTSSTHRMCMFDILLPLSDNTVSDKEISPTGEISRRICEKMTVRC